MGIVRARSIAPLQKTLNPARITFRMILMRKQYPLNPVILSENSFDRIYRMNRINNETFRFRNSRW